MIHSYSLKKWSTDNLTLKFVRFIQIGAGNIKNFIPILSVLVFIIASLAHILMNKMALLNAKFGIWLTHA
jgi:hypothetical protein